MLRIAHLSDIHAGYGTGKRQSSNGVNLREQDGYDALHEMVTDIINTGVDVALVAGDTFHTPFPSPLSIVTVRNEIERLSSTGVKVYILAGNHDVTDVRRDVAASKVLDNPSLGVFSYASPYEKVEVAPGVFFHIVSHHMFVDQQETMLNVRPVEGAVNILSTHGTIENPFNDMTAIKVPNSPREVVIPKNLYTDFDWNYSLFGHIHERGWTEGIDKLYYNGSLIRRGFSDKETGLGRGWTLWTVNDDGTLDYELKTVAQRPQFDFEPLDGKELSTAELSEKIIENLRKTQEDGQNYDEKRAPIVRQTLVNVSPAQYSALDFKTIDKESQHTFSYQTKTDNSGLTASLRQADKEEEQATGDLWTDYHNFIKTASSLEYVDKNMKEDITCCAGSLIKEAHDTLFEEED